MEALNVQLAGLIPTGGGEWVLILLIILLLFGGAKLPQLARGLGQSIKEFKKGDEVKVKVLEIDVEKERIGLGI